MGTHITFVRSINMDRWKAKEIKIMELGGNKKAHAFYAKNNMFNDGRPDHENPALSKYKMALSKQALELWGDTKTTKPAATVPDSAPFELDSKKEETKEADNFFESLSKPAHAATKVSDNQTSSSIYSFSNLKQDNQQVNLNAKKLDIDFGGDDFFDSFGMGDKKEEQSKTNNDNPFSVADTANTADESGPFKIGSGSIGAVNGNSQNNDFVKQKLKELEGKKAISSDDFKEPEDEQYKENFKRFSGAQAISSSDFFGEPDKDTSSQDRNSINSIGRDSFGDRVSEAAIYAADAVAQNAKKMKEKASNFFAAFSRPSE